MIQLKTVGFGILLLLLDLVTRFISQASVKVTVFEIFAFLSWLKVWEYSNDVIFEFAVSVESFRRYNIKSRETFFREPLSFQW